MRNTYPTTDRQLQRPHAPLSRSSARSALDRAVQEHDTQALAYWEKSGVLETMFSQAAKHPERVAKFLLHALHGLTTPTVSLNTWFAWWERVPDTARAAVCTSKQSMTVMGYYSPLSFDALLWEEMTRALFDRRALPSEEVLSFLECLSTDPHITAPSQKARWVMSYAKGGGGRWHSAQRLLNYAAQALPSDDSLLTLEYNALAVSPHMHEALARHPSAQRAFNLWKTWHTDTAALSVFQGKEALTVWDGFSKEARRLASMRFLLTQAVQEGVPCMTINASTRALLLHQACRDQEYHWPSFVPHATRLLQPWLQHLLHLPLSEEKGDDIHAPELKRTSPPEHLQTHDTLLRMGILYPQERPLLTEVYHTLFGKKGISGFLNREMPDTWWKRLLTPWMEHPREYLTVQPSHPPLLSADFLTSVTDWMQQLEGETPLPETWYTLLCQTLPPQTAWTISPSQRLRPTRMVSPFDALEPQETLSFFMNMMTQMGWTTTPPLPTSEACLLVREFFACCGTQPDSKTVVEAFQTLHAHNLLIPLFLLEGDKPLPRGENTGSSYNDEQRQRHDARVLRGMVGGVLMLAKEEGGYALLEKIFYKEPSLRERLYTWMWDWCIEGRYNGKNEDLDTNPSLPQHHHPCGLVAFKQVVNADDTFVAHHTAWLEALTPKEAVGYLQRRLVRYSSKQAFPLVLKTLCVSSSLSNWNTWETVLHCLDRTHVIPGVSSSAGPGLGKEDEPHLIAHLQQFTQQCGPMPHKQIGLFTVLACLGGKHATHDTSSLASFLLTSVPYKKAWEQFSSRYASHDEAMADWIEELNAQVSYQDIEAHPTFLQWERETTARHLAHEMAREEEKEQHVLQDEIPSRARRRRL